MQNFKYASLRGTIQINKEVAARDQIQMRKRRILNHIVQRKENTFAQLAAHAVAFGFAIEKATEPLRRNIGDFGVTVKSFAGSPNGLLIQIRGKHLEPICNVVVAKLVEQHRN